MDILYSMVRARRIAQKNIDNIHLFIVKKSPLIIETMERAACQIIQLILLKCPQQENILEEILIIHETAVQEAMQIFNEIVENTGTYENRIIAALEDVQKWISECEL